MRESVQTHVRAEMPDFVTIYIEDPAVCDLFHNLVAAYQFFHDKNLEIVHIQGLGGAYEVTCRKGPDYLGFAALGF